MFFNPKFIFSPSISFYTCIKESFLIIVFALLNIIFIFTKNTAIIAKIIINEIDKPNFVLKYLILIKVIK
jgi:hypothetical protein